MAQQSAASVALGRATRQVSPVLKTTSRALGTRRPPGVVDDRKDYGLSISASRWKDLATQSVNRARQAEDDLAAVMTIAAGLLRAMSSLGDVASLVRRGQVEPADGDADAVTRQALRRALQAKGLPDPVIEVALARADRATGAELFRSASGLADRMWAEVETRAVNVLGSLTGARFGQTVAALNQAKPVPGGEPFTDAHMWVDMVSAAVVGLERALLKALRAGKPASILLAAEQLGMAADNQLTAGAGVAARVAMSRSQSPAQADAGVPVAVEVGDTMRLLLSAYAIARTVSYRFAVGDGTRWLDSADGRSLRRPVAVRALTLEAMLKRKPRADRDYVIAGTVASIDIRHKQGSAYSSATLADSAGREARIAVPKIKVDSGGLAVGGAVCAAGRWETDMWWIPDGAGLLLGFTPNRSRATHDWTAWTVGELRPVFEAVPHGLDIHPSWDQGPSGAGNPLRYGLWCGTATSAGLRRSLRRPTR